MSTSVPTSTSPSPFSAAMLAKEPAGKEQAGPEAVRPAAPLLSPSESKPEAPPLPVPPPIAANNADKKTAATPMPPAPPSPSPSVSSTSSAPKRRASTSGGAPKVTRPAAAPSPTSKGEKERTKGTSEDSANTFERLHRMAEKKQEELEKKKAELEMKECTFKPKILRRSSASPSSSGSSSSSQNGEGDTFDRLYKQSLEYKERLERRARESMTECSFSPSISSSQSTIKDNSAKEVARHERLYQNAKLQEQKKKQREKELEDAAAARRGSDIRPEEVEKVVSRLYNAAELQEKYTKREQRKKDKEMEQCTFKPTIKPSPAKGGAPGREEGADATVYDRLFQDAERMKKKMDAKKWEKEKEEINAHTFSPKINSRRESFGPGSSSSSSSDDSPAAFKRLYDTAHVMKAKKDAKREELYKADHTFKPSIDPKSEKIMQQMGRGAGEKKPESLEEVGKRLYDTAAKIQEKRRQSLERMAEEALRLELAQCTFMPQTNGPKSRSSSLSPGKRASFTDAQIQERRESGSVSPSRGLSINVGQPPFPQQQKPQGSPRPAVSPSHSPSRSASLPGPVGGSHPTTVSPHPSSPTFPRAPSSPGRAGGAGPPSPRHHPTGPSPSLEGPSVPILSLPQSVSSLPQGAPSSPARLVDPSLMSAPVPSPKPMTASPPSASPPKAMVPPSASLPTTVSPSVPAPSPASLPPSAVPAQASTSSPAQPPATEGQNTPSTASAGSGAPSPVRVAP